MNNAAFTALVKRYDATRRKHPLDGEAAGLVEAIALDLGYASASAFITMFRRMTRITPDEFRRGMREGSTTGMA